MLLMFNTRIAFLNRWSYYRIHALWGGLTGRIDCLVPVQASPVLHTQRDLAGH